MRTSEAENGSGHLSGALPNLRKARVFHRTAGVVLSSAFVALPYLVARVGATLSIALFISTLFAAYYGAFQLVINHDINGAVANKTFRQVVSAAVGRRAGKFSVVVVWQWAAACTSNVALLALAGSFCATLASSACKSLPICQQLSVSSWILIFTFILLVVAAAEPLRKAALWLSALPGFLASLLLLALVITDAFFTSPQVIGRAPCDDSTNVLQRNLALPAVALGATAFIFGNHYLLPEALTSLQLPSGSPGAALEVMECLGSAYALVVLLYLPIAYLGFSAYGDCLSPNILDAPTGQPELQAAAAALLVLQALVDILVREDSLHPLGGERKASTALCSWLQRVVTILAGGVVAALLPMSLEFAGLAGGLFVLPIAFVLPALLSQATGVDSQWDPQWLLNTALVTVYSVVALIATSASIYSLFASASFQWLQITEGDINLWISGFGALPYMF